MALNLFSGSSADLSFFRGTLAGSAWLVHFPEAARLSEHLLTQENLYAGLTEKGGA